jgi:predicted metal-dependent peptidase
MYAEEIYEELKADILREDEALEYETDNSDDVQSQEQPPQTQEALQEEILQEQLLAEEAIALLDSFIQEGEVPKSIERFFQRSGEGILGWKEILRDTLDVFMRDDYTLMPPSKKLLSQGIYLPSSYSQTFSLVIAIDSSGSVDDTLLNLFLNEIEYLMEMVTHYKIDIIVCDDRVHSHHTFYTGEALEVSLHGGGGTDFRPVFSFVDDLLDDVKMLLYFTDLEGVFPQEAPPYEVRWISQKNTTAPFGEVIVLEAIEK